MSEGYSGRYREERESQAEPTVPVMVLGMKRLSIVGETEVGGAQCGRLEGCSPRLLRKAGARPMDIGYPTKDFSRRVM